MENKKALLLAIGWLNYSYDDFQQYLEEELEVEPTEAEGVLTELNKLYKREER